MTGWHRSTTNHHGAGLGGRSRTARSSGDRRRFNQGGILMTDASYKDVEVVFE